MRRIELLMLVLDSRKDWWQYHNMLDNAGFQIDILDYNDSKIVEMLVGNFFGNSFIENVESYEVGDETRIELERRLIEWDSQNDNQIMFDKLEDLDKIYMLSDIIGIKKEIVQQIRCLHKLGIHFNSYEELDLLGQPIRALVGKGYDLTYLLEMYYKDELSKGELLQFIWHKYWGHKEPFYS